MGIPYSGEIAVEVLPDDSLKFFGAGLSDQFDRLLTIDNVTEATSLSKAHIYRLMDKGEFPLGWKLKGSRRRVWKQSEVEAWVNSALVSPVPEKLKRKRTC